MPIDPKQFHLRKQKQFLFSPPPSLIVVLLFHFDTLDLSASLKLRSGATQPCIFRQVKEPLSGW